MNKLIIFNEPVQSVRKSQQTIHSWIEMIRLHLFSSRKLTDSNDPFRASLMEVILRLKDLHAYGKICESVHKTASANKICKRKRSFAKV